jgi:hypothetical protein
VRRGEALVTKEEVYDLARKRFTDPAVVMLYGGECILGYWVLKEGQKEPLMFVTPRQGVVVVERASSWEALAEKAGLAPSKKGKKR